MSLNTLINLAEKIVNHNTDGHFSILRFTIGWKVFLGTPNLDTCEERDSVQKLESFQTLEKN